MYYLGKIEELIKMIHDNNMKVGLALNPKTEISKEIESLIEKGEIDTILIMTVCMLFFILFNKK